MSVDPKKRKELIEIYNQLKQKVAELEKEGDELAIKVRQAIDKAEIKKILDKLSQLDN